ncbi:MAG: VTT domain-containing protein [Nocardioidaceae bacterium]
MRLLLATFAMGVLSAVVPLINMEAYIAGIAALIGDINIWLVALVAGTGQAVGKIPWYEVSRRSMDWSYIRRKMANPDWARRYERIRTTTDQRPWIGMTLLFTSSLIAIPPLAITAVLAGQLRFNRLAFHATIIVGRTLQFAALLGGVAWLMHR